jgi:uncharacterized membrane protein YbhN (UPF0104 family)
VDVTGRTRRIASAAVTLAFFALVVWLVGDELREVSPREILAALQQISAPWLAAACALTVAAYAVVASYDRLSARYAGVRLSAPLQFAIAFVSYAFNFNLGAMVGALAFRYRLYTRAGVETERVAAIAACSIATNWCGCLTVVGAMLLADPSVLERALGLSSLVARALGALALTPVLAYALATRVWRKPVRIRGNDYRLPGSRLALAQIGLGSAYWLIVPGILYALCPRDAAIPYSQIATAYGLAALGGVVVRVPAGLGVIEGVFLEVFRGTAGATPILAMLLAWRALFLLAPLLIAGVVVLVLESRSAKAASRPRGDARAAQRVAHRTRTPAPAARRR